MQSIRRLAERHPFWFVVALAVFQPVLAIPFIAIVKLTGSSITPLQLIIPTVQSVVILWFIRVMGWWQTAGLTGQIRNAHLLIYPALVHFVPALLYGTVAISAGWTLFYFLALLATGISEEGFARGVAVPVLLAFGKWAAVLVAAAIFSAGHLTNALFEDFSALQWLDKFATTFGFAVLYGALFLRTGSLLPLIFLHTVEDYIYVTSGTAGPFVAEALDIRIHLLIACSNLAVGLCMLAAVTDDELLVFGRTATVSA
ncbi:CPBP family intramembrane metalloprotease [Frigidibacter sp. RF13]|uniref:CPBP family intramembrane glutamic endopeptidase n=1 Tax=Frigidibacter sp. RF13 TaxID=2997340 RepID=UPI00226EEE9F|nr:CPBP family intramembrane glutamic endopeptidase [Frigidibacter sp. RF13]MCY1125742.1 CPBP family intramembrane metalloprotease [Frigidibacter sp. RF13]